MSIRSRALLVLAVALVPSACGVLRIPGARSSGAVGGRPVALLTEGSAFTEAVRGATVAALQQVLARPVRPIEGLPAPADAETKALAVRLMSGRSVVARYDWREPHCAGERAVLAGVTYGVDALYRVVLGHSEQQREASDAEWAELAGDRIGFRRLRVRPTVREEVLSGTVGRSAFVARDGAALTSVYRRRVTLVRDARRIDVALAVAEAVRELGPVPVPEWEGVARRLAKSGCPFLALAIADAQLAGNPSQEPVQVDALAAMRASLDRRNARLQAQEMEQRARAALGEDDVEGAAIASIPPAGDRMPSCHALCEMHMVEICNTDKVLWSAHRARWEATPCGTRREEPFLAACYREQWDTGTFETSCVLPCESSDEGRTRLTAILQEAGCVAGPGPS